MNEVLNYFLENWVWISPIALSIAIRIWPTSKDLDIIKPIFKFLDTIIPNLKKGGGKFTLILMFMCTVSLVNAQNYQAYRGVIYTGEADSLTFPQSDGIITYNRQTGKLQGREGGVYQNLISAGGGGSVTGATNGTELIGTEVGLGGNLTQNTSIRGAGSNNLTIQTVPTLVMTTSIGGSMFLGAQGGTIGMGAGSPTEIDIHAQHNIFEAVSDVDLIAGNDLLGNADNDVELHAGGGTSNVVLSGSGAGNAFINAGVVTTNATGTNTMQGQQILLTTTNATSGGVTAQIPGGTFIDLAPLTEVITLNAINNVELITPDTFNIREAAGANGRRFGFFEDNSGTPISVISSGDNDLLALQPGTGSPIIVLNHNTGDIGATAAGGTLNLSGEFVEIDTSGGGDISITPAPAGFLILQNLPTTCTGAPTNALANVGGVLTICP